MQWLYFGYLAAIKTQNGAAMSVGRISTFLDIYIQRDMERGVLTEEEAQELIDHLTNEIPYGEIRPYSVLQSAVLRRSGMGDTGSRRHWYGRTFPW